ncbi:MAG: hypothetical protein K5666_04200 [Bacilli bacterium]|nr:hypothetical protein [Bacilli bacterium]
MADVLTGATNQFEFRELPSSKIVLSPECYTRLSADINLCAFSGNDELEYGTFLYGKEVKPNVIYFHTPSKHDDYEPKFREFEVNVDKNGNELKMHKEFINNIENSIYDCIAHIHTHPYIGGTCRFFSNQDLRTIQTLQKDFQPSNGRKKYFFGGLLTVGPENTHESDEISFVFYDEHNGWYKITNIYVLLDDKEIPFTEVNGRPKMKI